MPPMPRMSPPQPMHAVDPRLGSEPSHPGARPLIDDPRLGYSTSPVQAHPGDGAGTRLQTSAAGSELKVTSYRGMIVLLLLMAAGIAAGVAIAMNTGQ
jgi:hypothetical protein